MRSIGWLLAATASACLLLCGAAWSLPSVSLGSISERQSVGITIYDPSLTLVQEERTVGLRKGMNEFQFTWGGIQLDPSSLQMQLPGAPKGVRVAETVFPATVNNTVTWRIVADRPGEQTVSISHFVTGMSWSTEYAVYVDPDEARLSLDGFVKLTNSSQEDYREASIRLLLGEVHRIPRYAPPPPAAAKMEAGGALASLLPEEIARAGFAEYSVYQLPGKQDLLAKETRRLPLFATNPFAFDKLYTYDERRFGKDVGMEYVFENSKQRGLGDPLAAGPIRVYRKESDGRLLLIGEDNLGYVPPDEKVKLYLGNARNVVVEVVQTDYKREYLPMETMVVPAEGKAAIAQIVPPKARDYVEDIDWKVTVRNRKAKTINLVVRQYYSGEVTQASHKYEKVATGTIEFKLELKAGATEVITYHVKNKVIHERLPMEQQSE